MDWAETPLTPPILGTEVMLLEFEPLTDAGRSALARFMALPPEALAQTFRHIYAYYRDFHAAVGGEDWLDAIMGVPSGPEAIWQHVRPGTLGVGQQVENGPWYVSLEASCDWEEEHGLNIVWQDGTEVVKVGSYDGHMTNEHSYGDATMANVVYAATDPRWRTLRGA
ncbi:DUF6985 domain-containing protein [Jannaschia pohangensis]|uniref:DUF6985 domain-containing protein n=1 Tax=Jannaschia pohangensis TaxID=390807 RepID=A0A1I3R2L1_9RHOB|nr:hypothetical protein [Jannaschia pohangensis]SFJ40764.1 hypothetical protein SAMN04488095_2770 [Jannaschia pohangensis]